MKIGNLEFNEEIFAIRKYRKEETESRDWYNKIINIMFTSAEVMKIKVDKGKTLDLNMKHFEMLKEWIRSMKGRGIYDENIEMIENAIGAYSKPRETHVYILCEDEIPVYVGIRHKRKEKEFYWGSSKTYKAKQGTKKYIIADNLDHKDASEIEEYLIRNLKEKYDLKNNTPGSAKKIRHELKREIKKDPPYEIYIRR